MRNYAWLSSILDELRIGDKVYGVVEAREAIVKHIDAAVTEERQKWVTASMKRLAKYDQTGIPPETQALIDAAVAEGRREELNNVRHPSNADGRWDDWKESRLTQLTPPKQEESDTKT